LKMDLHYCIFFRGGLIEESITEGVNEVEIFRHGYSEKAPDQVSKL